MEKRLLTLSDFLVVEIPKRSGRKGVRFTITDTFLPLDEKGKVIPGKGQTMTVPGNLFFVPPNSDGTPHWKPPSMVRGKMSYSCVLHSETRWREIYDTLMASKWRDVIAESGKLLFEQEGPDEIEINTATKS